MVKVYTTCRRRGYELVDTDVWEVTDDKEHLGFVYTNTTPYTPCDPPRYIQLDPDEHERILPKGSTIIEKRFDKVTQNVVYSSSNDENDLAARVDQIVKENIALRNRVRELESQPTVSTPTVELVDRWRLQFSWYGSWGELHKEWGFESHKEAEDRLNYWIATFGDKFKDVAIIPYKINREGL